LNPAALSDEQLLDMLQALARLRLGAVDEACSAVFRALQASHTLHAKLLADNGWELLVPLADQLAVHSSSLQSIESWLSDVSSGDLGPSADILAVQLSFAMLLGLSKPSAAAQQEGASATMQHNDSIEKPFASASTQLVTNLTRKLARGLACKSSQSGLLCCSMPTIQHERPS
jgi:hypothetical protein